MCMVADQLDADLGGRGGRREWEVLRLCQSSNRDVRQRTGMLGKEQGC